VAAAIALVARLALTATEVLFAGVTAALARRAPAAQPGPVLDAAERTATRLPV
jgi:hypothetical protein